MLYASISETQKYKKWLILLQKFLINRFCKAKNRKNLQFYLDLSLICAQALQNRNRCAVHTSVGLGIPPLSNLSPFRHSSYWCQPTTRTSSSMTHFPSQLFSISLLTHFPSPLSISLFAIANATWPLTGCRCWCTFPPKERFDSWVWIWFEVRNGI